MERITTKSKTIQEESSALVKADELTPSGPLTKIEDLANTWRSLQDKANLVSPMVAVDTIPALHGISLRSVMIDPSTNNYGQGPEVYRDARFCERDERALGGVALQKIAAAAGIQIIERKRLDDRSDPTYCTFETTVGLRDYDGTWRQVSSSKEIDLRDGAPETMKPEKDGSGRKTGKMIPIDASALADRRRHIQSLAETKSFYRALRTLLQLKQKYSIRELEKPFVVPKLVPMLDASDPDQKRALIAMATGQEAKLYGALPDGDDPKLLKDVTPESATSPVEAAENSSEAKPEAPHDDSSDFEPIEIPEEEIFVCECPCSCQAEISAEVARVTRERYGSPRCRDCFPGKGFDYERHKDLASLGLPDKPNLTADQVLEGLKKAGLR